MSVRAIPRSEEPAVAEAYTAGQTCRQIAAKYDCSPVAIRNALRRQGVAMRTAGPTPSPWGPAEQEQAARLYLEGHGVKEVARRFSVNSSRVSMLLRGRSIQLHPGGRTHPRFQTSEEREEVARLYSGGATLQELADRFGCTTPTVRKAIASAGGQARPVGRDQFWNAERLARLTELFAAGTPQVQIAGHLGVTPQTITRRLRMIGLISAQPLSGGTRERARHWKGGRTVTKAGYVLIRPTVEDRAYCTAPSGYVMEHRLVMGRAIGRPLRATETVHHIDGNPANNELENLQLRQGNHGKGVVMTCNSCGSHDVAAQAIAD